MDEEIIRKIEESDDAEVVDVNVHRERKFAVKLMIFIIGVLFTILIWYIVAWWYNTYKMWGIGFPDPYVVFSRFFELASDSFLIMNNNIWIHTIDSLKRWFMGFGIAFVIGVVLGIILGSSPKLYPFGMVPVSIIQMIPGLAWFPVTILLFGFGNISAVYIIAITVLAPITINVANGLRRVPEVNKRVADMCGRNAVEKYTEVMIPFSLLDILAGLRIGMANGWRVLISAEMVVGVSVGLGYSIKYTSANIDYVTAFACIIMICIIGLIIDKIILANLEQYGRKRLGLEE